MPASALLKKLRPTIDCTGEIEAIPHADGTGRKVCKWCGRTIKSVNQHDGRLMHRGGFGEPNPRKWPDPRTRPLLTQQQVNGGGE